MISRISPWMRLCRADIRWTLLVSCFVLCISVLAAPHRLVRAQAQDLCPEPNDEFQQACFLGAGAEGSGYISSPGDVDAYRMTTLDFNSIAHIELLDSPGPYKFVIGDWNGRLMATSTSQGQIESADIALPMPGSYYIFVQSLDGTFDEARSYRLVPKVIYATAAPPVLKYSTDFGTDETSEQGVRAINSIGDGKYNVRIVARNMRTTFEVLKAEEDIGDFTMTVDARIIEPADASYLLGFRMGQGVQNTSGYRVQVTPQSHQVSLNGLVTGGPDDITNISRVDPDRRTVRAGIFRGTSGPGGQTPSGQADNLNDQGGVNRTTIRVVGGRLTVNVNGREALVSDDLRIPSGALALGLTTPITPATVRFDNLLVTTPVAGAASAPPPPQSTPTNTAVFFADNFDDPLNGGLPKASTDPTRHQRGYLDGEYMLRRVDRGLRSDLGHAFPDAPPNVSIALDARLVGDTDGRYVDLMCRWRNNGSDAYIMVVMPHAGLFQILRVANSQTVPPETWRESAAIRRDNAVNHLELSCVGSTISALVNGEKVLDIQDSSIAEGGVAFGVGNITEKPDLVDARFDNLVVTRR